MFPMLTLSTVLCVYSCTYHIQGEGSLYWPKNLTESQAFGQLQVTLTEEVIKEDYVVRKLEVKHLEVCLA